MNKITLTGDLGSGKSATSRILCEKTGYMYMSTGNIQRKLAADMGIDTLEMNRRADTDPEIDRMIDSVFAELNNDPAGYVIDSRMAWFFVPVSFKVFLSVNPRIAAERILSDPGRNSEQYKTVEEAMAKILARKQSENARFLLKYGADCANMDNFDCIIDTTDRSQEVVAALILKAKSAREEGVSFPKYL